MLAVATKRVARKFNTGTNDNQVSTFKYFQCSLFLKHHPSPIKRACSVADYA